MSNASSSGWLERLKARWVAGPGIPSLIFGVVLPSIAIAFELTTRLCAQLIFDPLPTLFHVLLVAFVPFANFMTWRSFEEDVRWPRLAEFSAGGAIGIAAVYSLLFLPVLPIAVLGILYFGLGLLPWAPAFAGFAAISMQIRKQRVVARSRLPVWSGVACAVGALIVADLPTTLTRVGLRMATSDTRAEQVRGMHLLRTFGSEDVLLRLCYVRTGKATDLMSVLIDMDTVSPEAARQAFYRVTGQPFNARPAPKHTFRRGRGFFGGADPDFDQGADAVGGRLRQLSLVSSRLDGSIDANAALGYLEWTMVVRNSSNLMSEGRAQIAVPRGAVVSRLTLWIEGEEREAAFAARGQVKAAYQRVVSRRRDPVLVTTAGADRIDMRMFPVPAKGEMKVRIGMTLPITLSDLRNGAFRLPYFHERNFDIPETFTHSVWIEAKTPFHSELATDVANANAHVLRVEIPDRELAGERAWISLERAALDSMWARDSRSNAHLIKQSLSPRPIRPTSRMALVIDGSVSMAHEAGAVADAVAKLPQERELLLVFASDDLERAQVRKVTPAVAAQEIREHSFIGGHDNTAALAAALDALASESARQTERVLVWVHGPQPVLMATTDPIQQRLAREGGAGRWYDVQVTPGPNVVGPEIEASQAIETLSLREVATLFDTWRAGASEMHIVRERIAIEGVPTLLDDEQTSTHLARLWARDEVARLILAEPATRERAIALASEYQLVTPVTGAVVLETQQQYDEAGLTPVPPGTVPTIPEPEEWALIVVAIAILLFAYRRRAAQAMRAA